MCVLHAFPQVRGHTSHFLQGPKTDPEVVAIVNSRVTRGEGSRSRVVNYRKDGTAFENSVEVGVGKPHTSAPSHIYCSGLYPGLQTLA